MTKDWNDLAKDGAKFTRANLNSETVDQINNEEIAASDLETEAAVDLKVVVADLAKLSPFGVRPSVAGHSDKAWCRT